jgi:tripartite-type tricarboxylate transporter receptor subunit TctC
VQANVQRVNAELARILDLADVRKSFADQGADVGGGSPAAFDAFMRDELARWGAVVKEAGISLSEAVTRPHGSFGGWSPVPAAPA